MQSMDAQGSGRAGEGITDLMRVRVPRFMRGHRPGGRVGDQVVRLEQWQARHPGVEIQNPDYANGGQFWVARRGGEVLCRKYDLRVLLDHLDWLTAQDRPADA